MNFDVFLVVEWMEVRVNKEIEAELRTQRQFVVVVEIFRKNWHC